MDSLSNDNTCKIIERIYIISKFISEEDRSGADAFW